MAIAWFERRALDEPRSSAAFPDFRQMPGGVARHVRSVLVDDRHDTQRDAHPLDLEAVRAPRAVEDLTDRVRERGDLMEPGCHALDPRVVEAQPVDRGTLGPGVDGGLEIDGVGVEDLGCPVEQQLGRSEKCRVLRSRRGTGEDRRRLTGAPPELFDRASHRGECTCGLFWPSPCVFGRPRSVPAQGR